MATTLELIKGLRERPFASSPNALERCVKALEVLVPGYETNMNNNYYPDEMYLDTKDEMEEMDKAYSFIGRELTYNSDSAIGVSRTWMNLEPLIDLVKEGGAANLVLAAAVLMCFDNKDYGVQCALSEAELEKEDADEFNHIFGDEEPSANVLSGALLLKAFDKMDVKEFNEMFATYEDLERVTV